MKTWIYFVRHAASPFYPGDERNRGLSEQGWRDAVRVAELLRHEGIDVIASSSYARAVETAGRRDNKAGPGAGDPRDQEAFVRP